MELVKNEVGKWAPFWGPWLFRGCSGLKVGSGRKCMNLWLVSVWTLIHLQGQLLGVGGQGRPRCVYVRRVRTCVLAE